MIDPQSQHESPGDSEAGQPVDADAVSTVALAGAIPLLGEEPKPSAGSAAGSSSVTAGTNTPAIVPNDKTVISKRSPIESPLPLIPTPQTLGQALVGKTLDHYELVEFVGGGGMGAVFRSIDTRLGRTVAVKVLSRDHTDEETIKRFRNEAQSAARLDHPNIARVYFVGEAEGWNYIVFEYIEGTNLRDIVESSGPLPLESALDYALQVAEALDHASNRDVVHRDIKPSNVLVTPSGQAKLVDMGLARLHQVESSSEDLTASGVMLGTFDYISPEQARDPRSADVRSDIYSLGCTLYFMLTGRPPFPEGTAVQKLLKHNSEEPPDLRLFRPELPLAVTTLVARMLAKRPSQRQQSPQELIAEVLAVAHQLGLGRLARRTAVAVTVTPPAGSFWSRLLPIAVPVAALVLLLLLIDSLSRQGEGPTTVVQRPTFDGKTAPVAGEGADSDTSPAGNALTPAVAGSTSPEKSVSGDPITKAKGGSPVTPDERSKSGSPAGGKTNDSKQGANSDMSPRPSVGGSVASEGTAAGANTVAAPGSASDGPREIQRIIVRNDPTNTSVPEDAEVVDSLARACQLAFKETVARIELEFDGELIEQPFDVKSSRVEIVAAERPDEPGSRYRPVILFKPLDFVSKQMIRLSGGNRSQVTFRGVELRMELPDDPSDGWSLFALYQLQSLELTDTVLTVKCPGGAQGLVGYEPVAMLALQPYQPAEMVKMTDDMMAMQPSINVKLTNCVARGEATFLTAEEERPLSLIWSQGLFVTPLRLLDTRGSKLMKPSSQDKLEIRLEHVTAIVPKGLARQSRSTTMQSHLRYEVTCENCVIEWDPDAALFEFEGLPSENDIKLKYQGYNNLCHKPPPAFLRYASISGGSDPLTFPFDPNSRWGADDSQDTLEWASVPPSLLDLPAHEHVPQFYLLSEGRANGEGFDMGLLPKLLSPLQDPSSASGGATDSSDRPVSP